MKHFLLLAVFLVFASSGAHAKIDKKQKSDRKTASYDDKKTSQKCMEALSSLQKTSIQLGHALEQRRNDNSSALSAIVERYQEVSNEAFASAVRDCAYIRYDNSLKGD